MSDRPGTPSTAGCEVFSSMGAMIQSAQDDAHALLRGYSDRWKHVYAVGRKAEELNVPGAVRCAAWLHDVGYADELVDTGFHPLDGARWVRSRYPNDVVALVAYHTGADTEAAERGLAEALREVAGQPRNRLPLDMLTYLDLTTGPKGQEISVPDRLDEILNRYPADDPVHRAVARSRGELAASALRGKEAIGHPMKTPSA